MGGFSRTLTEALAVAGIGLALGLTANGLSSEGLRLDFDYFPTSVGAGAPSIDSPSPGDAPGPAPAPVAGTSPPAAGTSPPAAGETDAARSPDGGVAEEAHDEQRHVAERLAGKGLQAIFFDDVKATHEDPLHGYGAYLFLDARSEEKFAEGHIPGAYLFDPYHIDRHIDTVLAAVPGVMKIVIYCTGGKCEDSENAAIHLTGFGVPAAQIHVYPGGIEEWTDKRMPIERGSRGSGNIVPGGGGEDGAGGGDEGGS